MICSPSESPCRSKLATKRKAASLHTKRTYDDFVLIIPVIREHARVSFCKMQPEEKEELIEECLANAFRAYARLLELGKQDLIYPTVLAKFAVKQVRSGRRVGSKLNCQDVLSLYAQKRKAIRIERLDRFDPEEQAWLEAVVKNSETPVPEQVAFRVDFRAWLKMYRAPKRRIAETLALGYTTNEAARRFDLSAGRISQLRRAFERSWQQYQCEEEADEAELASA